MGCFSYICKESGLPINSNSFDGDAVHLFLLYKGEVIEEMYGNYNSYGRVFDGNGGSFDWNADWGTIVDLHFSDDESSGVAAVLDQYWDGSYPVTKSDDDPNQGWGEGDIRDLSFDEKVNVPQHIIYKSITVTNSDIPSHWLDELDALIASTKELLALVKEKNGVA